MHPTVRHRLTGILEGDREASAWLYDTFAPKLFRRLKQRYSYPGGLDGEDLLQDAFLFFFQNEGRVLRRYLERVPDYSQTSDHLETYLWDLACGVASNRRRSAFHRRVVSLFDRHDIPLDPLAERHAIDRDTLARLEGCLKEGRERVFLYYTLRYRDGLSPEEVSKACGWSRKATYKLKQVLDKAVAACSRLLGLRLVVLLALLPAVAACGAEPAPSLEAEIEVRVRNHQELVLGPAEPPLPRYLGTEAPLSLCLETTTTTDTSQWDAVLTLDGEPLTESFLPPSVGLGDVLCFDAPVPEDLPAARTADLGGRLRDRFDGTRREIPPRRVRLEPEDGAYVALRREMIRTARRQGSPPTEIAAELLSLSRDAAAEDFPQLALRATLMAVHFLRTDGSEESMTRARGALEDLPSWTEDEVASFWGSQVALTRADLALRESWNLHQAWVHLAEAEEKQARIADPTRIETVRKQSSILARVDAAGEGVARLRSAIGDCDRWPCTRVLLLGARVSLGWMTLLDPQADRQDYESARSASEVALEEMPAEVVSADQRANLLVNLAHLDLLLGEDPEPRLTRAAEILEKAPATDDRPTVEGWLEMIRGSAALAAGDARRGLGICVALAQSADVPQVAAWAWGCAGRALHRLGDLGRAAEAFDHALRFHSRTSPQRLGQAVAMGISRRSEDTYNAALLAVDRGDFQGAWELLALLDRLGERDPQAASCAAEESEEPSVLRAQRLRLLAELAALEQPATAIRRQQRETLGQSLRQRLQDLWRQEAACGGPEAAPAGALPGSHAAEPRFRAFLINDEAVLLELDPEAGARLGKRTPLAAGDLRRWLRKAAAPDGSRGEWTDAEWRRDFEPVARALVPPRPESLPPVTSFALHGILQDVPLAALPLEDGAWLSSYTVPVHRPAQPGEGAPRGSGDHPLFLVDPFGDLVSAETPEVYRRLFPEGRVLSGADATSQAFQEALGNARWLHIDAHGRFDPAYPELSSLRLADRPVTFIEIADLPVSLRFANLSSCLTGRWPVTADSGRYGIAGLLVKKGASWVIASREELDNRLARRFNRAFYQRIREGADVASAYAEALAQVRSEFPAAAWSALLLLGRPGPEGGNLPGAPLPMG